MKYNSLKEIIKYMKEIVLCSECNKKFLNKDITILGVLPGEGVFRLECNKCKHVMIVNIGINSSERKHREITKHDITDMHEFLKDFNGDFKNLFKITNNN